MSDLNRQFLLDARPVGEVKLSDLRYHETENPELEQGQFLVQVQYLGLEPAMRGWMENRSDYLAPLAIGDVMRSFGVGVVINSLHPDYPEGAAVSGTFGMQSLAIANAVDYAVNIIDPAIDPVTYISVLGITGLTAWCGMDEIGKPQAGETIVVSGAAGATGSIAGQIARIAGARVIGIAGSEEKCNWLTTELGFDAAVNYREQDVAVRLRALCPDGIDVYWDNVGGDMLDTALEQLAQGARVVVCGGISRYNATAPLPGPANYFNLVYKNALMQGFVVSHYRHRFGDAIAWLKQHLQNGDLRHREDILQGFERTPEALLRLFHGDNIGKQLVRV
ncbi:MAG: NADP-dependent oxidoreductase [Halioglobus sp.]